MGASNQHYHDWESHFALADELVAFGTEGVTYKTFPVIGVPDVRINPNFLDSGMTGRGRAERNQDEYAIANIDSGVSFQTRGGNVALYKMLVGLLQMKPTGVETPGASGKFKHTFTVYTGQPSVNFGFSAQHAMRAGATNESKKVLGNIVKSLHWGSAENDFVKMDVDTMAVSGGKGTLTTPAATWTNLLQHMHRHLILATLEAVAITPKPAMVDLTAVNNLVAWHGTSQTPAELVLGVFQLSGNMVVTARAIGMPLFDDFVAKNNKTLVLGWGTAVDDVGYVKFSFDVQYSDHKAVSRGGIQGTQIDFTSALAEASPQTTTIEVWHSSDLAA